MKRRLVVGNWKMHGSLTANRQLLEALLKDSKSSAEVAVCVPYPYLAQVADLLSGSKITWGAQDVSQYEQGAYTGEVSARMLSDFGCSYAIVGHSERRQMFGDTNEVVAAKALAAIEANLVPIVCVGETLVQRESGQTESIVLEQLNAVAEKLSDRMSAAVVAYEPVWAIGTGKTATPEQAQEIHRVLRARLGEMECGAVPLLYGGSVKSANAAELFAMPDIDGGLVGGASLIAEEFLGIINA